MSDAQDDVYAGLMGEVVRHARSDAQARFEIRALKQILDLPEGSRLLDVPCGAGRLSIGLAAEGYTVTGLDLSAPLLAMAHEDAAARHVEVMFMEGDMRNLPFERAFDGALCFWESFGYFDDAGNLEFLRSVAKALRPRGRFVMDTEIAESLFPKLASQSPRYWGQVNGITMLEELSYDLESGIWKRNWTVMRGEAVEHRTVTIRIYTYRELIALCREAGFTEFEAHPFLTQAGFKIGTSRLLLVATK